MQTYIASYMQFQRRMKQNGLRITSVRKSLFQILYNADKPLTIKQLCSAIEDSHFVSIYRSVEALQKAKIVKPVSQGFTRMFELGEFFRPHHHHLSCETCGTSVELQDPMLEKFISGISARNGYRLTKHQFELIGICFNCETSNNRYIPK